MSKSINIVFIKQKSTNTEGLVFIRTIEGSDIRKKSLQIKLSERDWERYFNQETKRFRNNKLFPESENFNFKIEEGLKKLSELGSLSNISNEKKSFILYWEKLIEKTSNQGSKIKHQTILSKLKKFLNSKSKRDLLFIDITPSLIRDLKHYLETIRDPKHLSTNSITHYLKVIKSIINKSILDDYYTYSKHPFGTFKFSTEKILKEKLSDVELITLIETNITDEKLIKVRDMFLFQLFSNGMRISDLLLLRWESINRRRVNYSMYKTKREISIPLNMNLTMILSRILKVEDTYKSLIRDITIEFLRPDNKSVIGFENWNLGQFDNELIDYLKPPSIDDKKYKTGVEKFLYQSRFNSREIINYKGYFIDKKQEKLIDLIDTREKLINEINKMLINNIDFKSSKKDKKEFIFPILDNRHFENYDGKTKLNLTQYKSLKHSTIVYNRQLKKLQDFCEIETNMSSHVPRHTYTNLLLKMKDVNLYDISQSLGHSNLKITENYISSGFNIEKLDYLNKSISQKFDGL